MQVKIDVFEKFFQEIRLFVLTFFGISAIIHIRVGTPMTILEVQPRAGCVGVSENRKEGRWLQADPPGHSGRARKRSFSR